MQVELLRTTATPHVIDKSFTKVDSMWGEFNQPFDHINPTLRIDGTKHVNNIRLGNITHVKVDKYYYYIKSARAISAQIVELNLHMDVLTSYKSEIDSLTVFLERSNSPESEYLPDDTFPIDTTATYEVIDFPNVIGDQENEGMYVMTVAQKGYMTPGGD